ncbi:hypothetical protein QYE76_023452 [Lolium multiflorum]|uniref:Uncharacterized protein n=1 Tax=Lolium multiflorum TaxID=4521 RepID=A0AAD8RBP6_LOLMU|nr:hypothetical protein QYE76_023452 [Lolium multiflorum]
METPPEGKAIFDTSLAPLLGQSGERKELHDLIAQAVTARRLLGVLLHRQGRLEHATYADGVENTSAAHPAKQRSKLVSPLL